MQRTVLGGLPFPNAANPYGRTGCLLAINRKDPLFHSRRTRTPGLGDAANPRVCSEFVKSLTDSAGVRVYSGSEGSNLPPVV